MAASVMVLIAVFFINSCASAFSFNQSLRSRILGFTQCFLTVTIDYDSFIFGVSFCTVDLRSAALFKSESYESDLKTPTRLEMHPEQLIMFLLLCFFSGRKKLSLSKCALTTASSWLNLRSSVLSASFYIIPQYANSLIASFAFPVNRVFK